MEKLRITFIIAALGMALQSHAYWRVVVDPWTAAQVVANTGAQTLIEKQHNGRLDSIRSKQQKIMEYTATMAVIKETYQLTLQNISGFGEESKYYGEIIGCATDILTDVPQVIKSISGSPGKNTLLCMNELTNIVAETKQLVTDFVDIVNNGKIRNPYKQATTTTQCPKCGGTNIKTIKTTSSSTPYVYVCQGCGWNTNAISTTDNKNDGYNLLDRYERLNLANKIYTHLLEMKYKMDAMVMMCEVGTWKDALFNVDPESWAAFFTGANMVDGLINDWNSLGV